MQCYTELLPPSGVTDAIAVPFISATSNNLIVAKTSLLQVFSLINVAFGATPSNADEKPSQDRLQYTKLVLTAEYDVPGTITGLGRVKILESKSGGEAVLIATRNAKLSLIEWDPERHGISTISIHYYEGEDVQTSPWVPDLRSCPSFLTVDPSNRCAILNFGLHNLAILPFHQIGDDLVMDDYDSAIDGDRPEEASNDVKQTTTENAPAYNTPYASSFVLPLTALDPSLIHPVNLSFLYEYREPTFGILYSETAPSSSLLFERKDVLSYAVFTLDLQQRASTTLLTVSRLPSDLFQVIPLPPPIGGSLLMGSNELIHIDQAGKTNAVGVNEFARYASTFSMADQSDLEIRLEGCVVEQLGTETGDALLALSDGKMAVLSFKVDGRSVSGISLRLVAEQAGGAILKARPSCSTVVGKGKVFFGSEEGDSILIGWSKSSSATKKPRPHISSEDPFEGLSETEEDEGEDMYEDDLYSNSVVSTNHARISTAVNGGNTDDFIFRPHDRLWNLGPMRDVTLGVPPRPRGKDKQQSSSGISPALELVAARGYGRAGGLAILRREIDPLTIDSMRMDDVYGVWSIQVRNSKPKEASTSTIRNYDRYLLLAKSKDEDKEESAVYSVGSSGLDPIKASEFNPNEDCTIDIGTLASGTRVVQVLKTEVRSYDSDLALAQIYPVWDDDTSEERTVITASFSEPYLLTIRDDRSLLILQTDESGDLDEVPIEGVAASTKWLSGCLYEDKAHVFFSNDTKLPGNTLLFLLSCDNKLVIFRLPNISEPLISVDGVNILPPNLSCDPLPRRPTTREVLSELLVSDLGDPINRNPYIILRTTNDDLILYEPYRVHENGELRFVKVANHFFTKPPADSSSDETDESFKPFNRPLRALADVSGYKTVFMPGLNPCFIMKSSISRPHILRLRGKAVQSLSSLHIPACERGFAYIDSDNVIRMSKLPGNTRFDNSWVTRKIALGEQVDYVQYASRSEAYVIGISHNVDFKLPDNDESHTEWRNETISFMPKLERGTVKLIEPRSWSSIDSYTLDMAERITCIESINLEVSEISHERKEMIVVGTAIVRGEDIVPRGCVYIFEIINVVPEPDRPETNRRLKLIAKEEVKGAVTALSGIGGQGFLIIGQGQKCMVRGLKEDGSLLPVAFMDMQCYVNVLKELKGTGMCIMGDALEGLWFTGYSEEPYKLSLFGKDNKNLPVMAADFLPDGKRLYILVADDDCNIHILQYDPEDPSSSKGDRLLHRSVFHSGHFISTMTLLPQASTRLHAPNPEFEPMETDSALSGYQVLITSQTGSIGVVTPLAEDSYRRLLALQSQLVNTLEHPCGLNPRAYRATESDGIGGQRGMIDGNLLRRWLDMGAHRKVEIAGRVGADAGAIRTDIQALDGGLAYL